MRETRVNLEHLLEDIRDSYSHPIEEVIILELVANSLDSKASKIDFFTDAEKNTVTVVDNGNGMKRKAMKEYHNIAATTKVRGKGIGFAGIGAKLSLLISNSIITETKGGAGSRCATEWHLKNETRAPWNFITTPGVVQTPRGTAVTINLATENSSLVSEEFIAKTVKRHYYPLLSSSFNSAIFKHIYKKGVAFYVNGNKIEIDNDEFGDNSRTFQISFDKRRKGADGFGYLTKSDSEVSSDLLGIGISTYGKVIKRGWEWLGIFPKSGLRVSGLVEIPALSEILTTNKSDFLKDSASLNKYYKYRKAIQEVVLPIFEEFGERDLVFEKNLKRLRPLEKEIERTLGSILNDFPELSSLVSNKMIKGKGKTVTPSVEITGIKDEGKPVEIEDVKEKKEKKDKDPDKKKQAKKKRSPGLSIAFEENLGQPDLARMTQDTIWVNISHPAYIRAKREETEGYHILLCVAWSLSEFIEEDRSPQEFISHFLASWADYNEQKSFQMF